MTKLQRQIGIVCVVAGVVLFGIALFNWAGTNFIPAEGSGISDSTLFPDMGKKGWSIAAVFAVAGVILVSIPLPWFGKKPPGDG